VRVDRFEINFWSADSGRHAEFVASVWRAVAACAPEVAAKSYSILFEVDGEFSGNAYGPALAEYCKPLESLPKGTETAVVYYLPPDTDQGFLDSSIVLNRSSEVEGGILIAATLDFGGSTSDKSRLIPSARKRFLELLGSLQIAIKGLIW
jgi:hypothetical protein